MQTPGSLPPRQASGVTSSRSKGINWLLLVFAAQMVLFMTFIGSFFTMETHRQSELHDMSRELHRLRSENRRVTKRLLSAEKRNTRLLEETQSDLAFERTGQLERDDHGSYGDGGGQEGEDIDASDGSQGGGAVPHTHHGTWANATVAVPGGLSGRCARLLREGEWWTYEVCVGGLVRQFHDGDSKGKFDEYVMGQFDPSVALGLKNGVTHFAFNKGAPCSPTDATPRSARLTVRCVSDAAVDDLHLLSVTEPHTCSYALDAEAPIRMCTGLPSSGGGSAGASQAAAVAKPLVVQQHSVPPVQQQQQSMPGPAGGAALSSVLGRPAAAGGVPRGMPAAQLGRAADIFSVSTDGAVAAPQKRAAVVGAVQHAWGGYVQFAWGADELKPISRSRTDWIGLGLTILDSLDVLWMAGLEAEWDKAVGWVSANLNFNKYRMVSFFETTIRCLGGLLTAYELGGDRVLLDKATDLGERLAKAFAAPSGLPYTTVSLGNGQHSVPSWTGGNLLLAEVGTVQLEFFALAKHTGRNEFHQKAQHVIDVLDREGGPASGGARMWPIHIRPDSGKLTGSQISWGAMGDSYYEYLLKMWLYTGKRVEQYKRMYLESVRGMQRQLIFTEGGYTFLAESNNHKVIKKMDHLVCFVPGMLALGAQHIPEVRDEHMALAEKLVETCYKMYANQRTGLAPEFVRFGANGMSVGAGHNLLRPEAIEAIFYMWRFTKQPKYREWGWKMFLAFEKYTKVATGGYSGVKNVNGDNAGPKDDTMQTFWIAESLKYFLLLFSDDEALDLNTHVLNTEAHPLRAFT